MLSDIIKLEPDSRDVPDMTRLQRNVTVRRRATQLTVLLQISNWEYYSVLRELWPDLTSNSNTWSSYHLLLSAVLLTFTPHQLALWLYSHVRYCQFDIYLQLGVISSHGPQCASKKVVSPLSGCVESPVEWEKSQTLNEISSSLPVTRVTSDYIMVMDVASYIKSMLKTDSVCIDNFVFRLHYRVTVAILLASSIIGMQCKDHFDWKFWSLNIHLVIVRGGQAVLRGPHQLPDELRRGEQGAGRLLLDTLNLPHQIGVPGQHQGAIIQILRFQFQWHSPLQSLEGCDNCTLWWGSIEAVLRPVSSSNQR